MIAAATLLLALAACTQPVVEDAPPAATITSTSTIPAVSATNTPTPTLVPAPTQTSSPTATAIPSATPVPTVTPVPPTATPQPTATPLPTATPTPPPTATPQPTATPRPPPPGSTQVNLGAGVVLSVSPGELIAGRNVFFALSGLTPWAPVKITFVDPQGVRTAWITPEDVNVLEVDRTEATAIRMFPDASGYLEWTRYGAQDTAGNWSVDIDLGSAVYTANYTLNSLKLRDLETVSLGTLLTRHPASGFSVYYSDLVPTALVIDLQEHLGDAALLLERSIQTEPGTIPDVYLMGNRDLMKPVSSVTGIELGFEDGYYTNFGERPGIFMRTDLKGTEVRRLLTHEYVHHVFDGLANERPLPAWLTEGLSKYYEFDIAVSGPRPDATQLRQLTASDLARAAAQAGTLFSLATLDSQTDWNSRTDENELSLQYAEAYMAIRFLNETFGPLSGKNLVELIGLGFDLSESIITLIGLSLDVFESQFNRWLAAWEDPVRGPIAEYLTALEAILAVETANSEQRARNIGTPETAEESIRSRAALVKSTEELVDALQALSPPERAQALHQEAGDTLGRVLVWLTLELQSAETRDNSPLNAANDMIPELSARDFTLKRNISNLKFLFNIPD